MADGLEVWIKEADVDGFNFVSATRADTSIESSLLTLLQAYVLFPQSFKDIIDLLLPELRRRGLFWDDYDVPSGTYRENFYGRAGQRYPPDQHVASSYHWKAGVPASEHAIPK